MLLNILAVGDVVGEGGQDILSRRLPGLREETGAHFCVVNGENASGVGITPAQARRILEAGADVINDVSGFGDEMLRAVAGSGCGCVVMHPRGAERGDILSEVREFFEERLEAAGKLGIEPERLCFDPGIGFGKTHEDNLRLIAHVERIKVPGIAYLMAASRKRVTGIPCGSPPFEERLAATLAAHTAAVLGGANMVRAHDVREAVQAARMADALKSVE